MRNLVFLNPLFENEQKLSFDRMLHLSNANMFV